MPKLLVLYLEKPNDFPYGPPVEIAESLRDRDLGADVDCVIKALPRSVDGAAPEALKVVDEVQPDQVIILTFDPLHMEIVLYRYVGNQWGSEIVDNDGNSPTEEEFVPGGQRLHIATTDFFKLFNYWQENQQGQLAHAVAGLHAKGDIENGVAYQLLSSCKPENTKVGLIGVPVFHDEHKILRPQVLKETVYLFLRELMT